MKLGKNFEIVLNNFMNLLIKKGKNYICQAVSNKGHMLSHKKINAYAKL